MISILTSMSEDPFYEQIDTAILTNTDSDQTPVISLFTINKLNNPIENSLLLEEILNKPISDDDVADLIALCIESETTPQILISLTRLLVFRNNIPLEIKLLYGIHPINEEFYNLAKSVNVYDKYYDRRLTEHIDYEHPNIMIKDRNSYRDIYHCLLYAGSEHCQALIVKWDLSHNNTIISAARDYFRLDCSDFHIIDKINKRSMTVFNKELIQS